MNRHPSLLAGAEFEVDSSSVLELMRDSDCSAYDCEFIALAIKLNTKLTEGLVACDGEVTCTSEQMAPSAPHPKQHYRNANESDLD